MKSQIDEVIHESGLVSEKFLQGRFAWFLQGWGGGSCGGSPEGDELGRCR